MPLVIILVLPKVRLGYLVELYALQNVEFRHGRRSRVRTSQLQVVDARRFGQQRLDGGRTSDGARQQQDERDDGHGHGRMSGGSHRGGGAFTGEDTSSTVAYGSRAT